ncbi:CD276 antigen-like [Acanthochromis polyacanthus]|uniref:CD276 antigen-like n=1 Tax=Acanthochromis polyacanthus TaxID=80966 RepID=UPI002234659E|nr:CD276 antigen-like [Acanthochromis polyacanthus]
MLLNPRRTRTNMKLLQLVWIFLLTLCGQSAVIKMKVKEGNDAILDCSFGTTNIENGVFDWKKDNENKKVFFFSQGSYYGHGQIGQDPQFEGRVSHFADQLQLGNASIKIKKAKLSDSGTYTCYSISPQPQIRSSINLTVDPILKPRPAVVGASPLPYITFNRSDDEVLLKCEVNGSFPEPEVEWWDSDGNVLAVGDPQIRDGKGKKYDTIVNVTVTKAGFYRCVATQKEIYHQVFTKAYVPHPGPPPNMSVTNVTETKDGVLLQCEVLGASPEHKVFWKNRAGNLVLDEELQKTETGGGYDLILKTTVKRNDYYRCVITEGKMDDEIYSEIFVPSSGDNPRSSVSRLVPAAVVGVLGLVAAVVV